MILHPDKFGFYESNGHKTYSKCEALDYGKPTWNFNDDIFSAFDWTKEPEKDLWEMYLERARQIREAYDYVVIWYSGGSDSQNILDAWLAAGLKIDELAITWNYDTTGELYNHQNAEITKVVIPRVKELKRAGHDFKFRLIDIAPLGMKLFSKLGNDIEYSSNFAFQVSTIGKQFFREEIKDYRDLISSGKRLCFVWGKEKPCVMIHNGKYGCRFMDTIDDCVGPYVQRKFFQGWYDELFYWTPDYPLLPIKMAHVVKNVLKYSTNRDIFTYIKERKEESLPNIGLHDASAIYEHFYLRQRVLKKILYPKWSNDTFTNDKAPSRLIGWRDQWFVDSNLSELSVMRQALESYKLKTNQGNYKNSILPVMGKTYYLE